MRKEMWEAKDRYVDKVMRENRRVETLTEEQHDILEELCAERHNLHTNSEKYFYGDGIPDDFLTGYDGNFSERLEKAGLPKIELIDVVDLVMVNDYYDILSEEERDYWENRAEECGEDSGLAAWIDEEAFEEHSDMVEDLNRRIESYLREIDTRHGTKYCPTGWARMRG